VELLGPPVEAGGRADAVGLRLQGEALGELGVFELLDRGEAAIDEGGVRQWPGVQEVLGRLHLRRVGWQEEHMDVLGYRERARVP
jgi:hypothetical protein